MTKRTAIGLALLLSSASCLPPRAGLHVASPPIAPMAARSIALAGLPAGPVPLLLAPPPATADTGEAAIAEAPAFLAAQDPAEAARALDCLTAAVYYEARSEPIDGQRAVAQVVLNRVRNPAFPSSVCGVVYQGSSRRTGCQFTFTCDGSLTGRREPSAWDRARAVAAAALAGNVYAGVGAATYYHSNAVSPWWAPSLTHVADIGAHIFYRLRNAWSSALDFRQSYAGVEPQPGTDLRSADQAADAIRFALATGGTVTVHHSGADAGSPAATSVAADPDAMPGITVHRGTAAQLAIAGDGSSGVRVHVGHAETAPADTPATDAVAVVDTIATQ